MKNEHKIKSFFKGLNENWQDPKKKIIIFFAFYFVFFAVLITLIRINRSNMSDNRVNKVYSIKEYTMNNLEKNNYHYLYEFNTNNKVVVLDGERLNDIESFTIKENNNAISYYKNIKGYQKKENGRWVKCDNPNEYAYITNIDTLKQILDNATYISKTEYDGGKKSINYEISTTTLCKIIDGENIDISDKVNKIAIKININKEVEGFELDLGPYLSYINNSDTDLTIKLDYNNFGEIEEIPSPNE